MQTECNDKPKRRTRTELVTNMEEYTPTSDTRFPTALNSNLDPSMDLVFICYKYKSILKRTNHEYRHYRRTDPPTNQSTPQSDVLLEKPTVAQIFKKFQNGYRSPKVHYRAHKWQQLVPILSQMNQIHIRLPYPRFVLILSSQLCLGLLSDLFHSVFWPKFRSHFCCLTCLLHVPSIAYSSIWWHWLLLSLLFGCCVST
jgi:hypothetical protein